MSLERAHAYLTKIPSATEPGRNDALNRAAFAILERFNLAEHEFTDLLTEWARACHPPIPESEIAKTLRSAWNGAHAKGAVASKANAAPARPSTPVRHHKPSPKPASAPAVRRYEVKDESLPDPIADGARALLLAAFEEGEGVRIANAKLNEEAREVPANEGPCLRREEWLKKLDAVKGNPNGIFSSTKRTGIYISINPMKVGGSKDSDVTAFRHVLIESDEMSVEEQWNLYRASNIPCTAIISSGGKSLHAWVRVDASCRAEYDERVRILYDHFAAYNFDPKNRNPSRFSRLPNCIRFDRRQELLALKTGAASFTEWLESQNAESLGEEFDPQDLLDFEPDKDPNTLLGKRWLCKGGSLLIVAPSGVGKSALAMQMALGWANGMTFCGIAPVRRLKSLLIQAENDKGDMAEMFQGVCKGMGIDVFDEDKIAELKRNIAIVRVRTRSGERFLELLRRLIDKHKPDLVWIDPLMSFVGDDISRQPVIASFFRDGLDGISESTGVTFCCVHHTGKPPADKKAREGWTNSDHAYAGYGSSDLTNWARAAIALRRVNDATFELKLVKREKRAGATHPNGEPTTSLWLQHAAVGILWEQLEPPEESEPKNDRPGRPGFDASKFNYSRFLDSIKGESFTVDQLAARAAKFAGVSKSKLFATDIPKILKERMRQHPKGHEDARKWFFQ